MLEEINNIINQFNIDGELIDIKCKNNGNINKTYITTYKMFKNNNKQKIKTN